MEAIVSYAQTNIVLLLFFVVGVGYLVGKLKIGPIALGSTTGVLFVGLLVGLLHFEVPPIIKGVFFTLYLFALGVQIGPGLVHILVSPKAIKYLTMVLFTTVLMGVTVYFVAKFFGLDAIVTGGLAAGAMTTSAALAGAQSAVSTGSVGLPQGMQAGDAANIMGSAYAITYLFGTFGLILLIKLCPKLVGKDIAVEAAKLASGDESQVIVQGADVRAWRLTNDKYIGKRVSELEAGGATHRTEGAMPSVEQVLRNGERLPVEPDLVLQSGDVVTVAANPEVLTKGTDAIGEEVTDRQALSVKLTSAELVLTSKSLAGTTVEDFVLKEARGVTIERMVRGGNNLPVRGDTQLVLGDVVFVNGPQRRVDSVTGQAGYVVKDQLTTDLVTLGLFLAIFGAIATFTVTVFGITLAVLGGAPIGAMFGGAILAWLRTRSPRLGSVSMPAATAFTDLGLAMFIAAVALGAGGSLVSTMQSMGASLLIAGFIVTTVCTIGCFLFGHFILRLNVAENAGATTGTMTGVAISEVCKDAKSSVPAVAYGLPGTLANVTFTLMALLIMELL